MEKIFLMRKLDWLADFKNSLIADIAARGFSVPLVRSDKAPVAGPVKEATEEGVILANGQAVPWTQISPETILQLAARLAPTAPSQEQKAQRWWEAGLYALLSQKTAEARELLGNAAKVRLDFKEALPILLPASANSTPNLLAAVGHGTLPSLAGTDVGAKTPSGTGQHERAEALGVFTIHAAGDDIWKDNDQFYFLNRDCHGDGSIIAYIQSIEATDPWAKCGVMYRQSYSPTAPMVCLCASAASGALFETRSTDKASAGSTKDTSVPVPCWLKLVRKGDNYSAFFSLDGFRWKQIGQTETVALGPKPKVGIAAAPHVTSKIGTSKISDVQISGN